MSLVSDAVDKALHENAKREFTLNDRFVYFDGVTRGEFSAIEKLAGFGACSEAERISLVKASKSPTIKKPVISAPDMSIYEPIKEIDDVVNVFESNAQGPGKYSVVHYRDWSEEYRVRTRVETALNKPPINDGPRKSTMLTSRGARKITESCYYMAKKKGGFKTFVTGTFSDGVREKIAQGETTVQKEVSRTMDAMQKMYQRGWTDNDELVPGNTGERLPGHDAPLSYCWVVEIPKNENGEDNPHVHMMIDWRVKKKYFPGWSARIEGIWGNGYFHLEKIKDPLCAGAYMAKAAGYMTKASKQDDQGEVKGNRYGISKSARAPGWVIVLEAELGIMGALISEVNERCRVKYDRVFRHRNNLRDALEKCPKELKKTRIAIGKKLQKVRTKINELPVVASKYQIILKTKNAFSRFLGFATAQGWNARHRPCSRWLGEFQKRLEGWRADRAIKRHAFCDDSWRGMVENYSEGFINEVMGDSEKNRGWLSI